MAAVTSSRVGGASAQLSLVSSSLTEESGKVPSSPGLSLPPRPAPEPSRLSGVYRIKAATLWDLACFHFCSQLSGLHGLHLQVCACLSPTMQPCEAPPAWHAPPWPLFSSAELPVLCLAQGRTFLARQDELCWSNLAIPFPRFTVFVYTLGCGAVVPRPGGGICVAALDWPLSGWLILS